MTHPVDPGYGDPNAPVGSPEWAKRWRLCFQNAAGSLPRYPKQSLEYYELGAKHRAWTMLTDDQGNHFKDFDAFCRFQTPWGLGMDPAKFRAYLAAEVGERAADLETVSPGSQGERTDLEGGTSYHDDKKSPAETLKAARLRAILRSPEVVQDLYREGLIPQTVAAKLGPKSPTPEKAAQIAEARQRLEKIPKTQPAGAFRAEAKKVVAECLGVKGESVADQIRRLWGKLTEEERQVLREELLKTESEQFGVGIVPHCSESDASP